MSAQQPWEGGDEEMQVSSFMEFVQDLLVRHPEMRKGLQDLLRSLKEEALKHVKARKQRPRRDGGAL